MFELRFIGATAPHSVDWWIDGRGRPWNGGQWSSSYRMTACEAKLKDLLALTDDDDDVYIGMYEKHNDDNNNNNNKLEMQAEQGGWTYLYFAFAWMVYRLLNSQAR